LLRSIAVRPDYRGLGLAARLTRFLLQRAESDGRAAVYLLTENAAGYFSRRGFVTVERAEVPQALRRTRQFTTLCPQSASCMRIVLPVAATAEQ
jgi:N-acetylglutamate synthase-like GNAT family acetyltransferase